MGEVHTDQATFWFDERRGWLTVWRSLWNWAKRSPVLCLTRRWAELVFQAVAPNGSSSPAADSCWQRWSAITRCWPRPCLQHGDGAVGPSKRAAQTEQVRLFRRLLTFVFVSPLVEAVSRVQSTRRWCPEALLLTHTHTEIQFNHRFVFVPFTRSAPQQTTRKMASASVSSSPGWRRLLARRRSPRPGCWTGRSPSGRCDCVTSTTVCRPLSPAEIHHACHAAAATPRFPPRQRGATSRTSSCSTDSSLAFLATNW